MERRKSVICAFDQNSPKISTYDIHEWFYETLRISEQEVTMIQIDGTKRHVYIKLVTEQMVYKILQDTNGHMTYKHADGLISTVLIEIAGMGTKSIRIANLPPEVPEHKIQAAMTPYGKIISMRNEICARTYCYAVPNGIRQINISLQHHIPSHLIIAGYRVLISYEGQPQTCYGCGATAPRGGPENRRHPRTRHLHMQQSQPEENPAPNTG
jgi:sRNA-binding regulator protein Hfq